ncbi:hypothetical protein [Humibacter ginsengisoli]
MSRAQAKANVVDLVDETVKSLPVGGWKVVQDPYEEDCSVDDGKVMYSYLMAGNVGKDPDADAATVAALWKKHGLKVTVTHAGGHAREPEVSGTGGSVDRIGFLGYTTGYAITGVSRCVP